MIEAPKVDERTPEQLEAQVRRQLGASVEGGWPARRSGNAADALIGVFAHLCGTAIDRLNKAPRKNLLAFLDMLGAAPLPPQPARAPLTFHMASQHTGRVIVPALTQAAAPPAPGEQQPTIFETEEELAMTPAKLVSLSVKEPAADSFSDYSLLLTQPDTAGAQIFRGSELMAHILYIDLNLPSPAPPLQRLRLTFELQSPAQPVGGDWLAWEVWDGKTKTGTALRPVLDQTEALSKTGDIVFEALPPIPRTEVAGIQGYWLRCRTTKPLKPGARVPSISAIAITLESSENDLPADAGFANATPVDLSKEFFPFGEQPRFGDMLLLASHAAFSKPGAAVTLKIGLTNPSSGGTQTPLPPVSARSIRLRWELWDGRQWILLGVSESGREMKDEALGFIDTTKALTESGTVTVRIPVGVASRKIAGLDNFWIRVRIVAGDYGREAHYEKGRDGAPVFVPPSFTPPSISSLQLAYQMGTTVSPLKLVTHNDFTDSAAEPPVFPLRPFEPMQEPGACCYFGFAADSDFSEHSLSIYCGVAKPPDRAGLLAISLSDPAPLIWEYWNGSAWTKRTVIDDTAGFRRSGLLRFIVPRDFERRNEFGKKQYWLRVHRADSGYEPRLRFALLNTVMASQSITMPSEILGSSNGRPGQRFRTAKCPVLPGQHLEVLEPTAPLKSELAELRREQGDDAVRKADPGDIRGGEVWVRWREVPNFKGSGPRDRHYVIERATGEVVFGDDVNGRIPPPLVRNIVMTTYRIGGGASGNRPAHTIEQLKTTIPYVDKVTNPEPATGGADAETLDRLLEHAPHELRHGFRAVTVQDFEDLAMLASPEAARARCVPLYDLARDPDALLRRPGVVSLIVVPVPSGESDLRPIPSVELIRRVRSFLDDHRLVEADLVLVGPEYVAIKVQAEITVIDFDTASEVELAVVKALTGYLHPLTGRLSGSGWQFGQEPAKSELYALIEGVPGVDHVRELTITAVEDRAGTRKAGYFLICAAPPEVTATLEK